LLVATDNINNKELLNLFDLNIGKIIELFINYSLVEINNNEIIGHE